eukprot:COSAG02_NODE_1481_length_12389_cov_15.643857_15_plen_71_part_00
MGARWHEEVYALLREGIASHTFPAAAVAIGVADDTRVPAPSNIEKLVARSLRVPGDMSASVCATSLIYEH